MSYSERAPIIYGEIATENIDELLSDTDKLTGLIIEASLEGIRPVQIDLGAEERVDAFLFEQGGPRDYINQELSSQGYKLIAEPELISVKQENGLYELMYVLDKERVDEEKGIVSVMEVSHLEDVRENTKDPLGECFAKEIKNIWKQSPFPVIVRCLGREGGYFREQVEGKLGKLFQQAPVEKRDIYAISYQIVKVH